MMKYVAVPIKHLRHTSMNLNLAPCHILINSLNQLNRNGTTIIISLCTSKFLYNIKPISANIAPSEISNRLSCDNFCLRLLTLFIIDFTSSFLHQRYTLYSIKKLSNFDRICFSFILPFYSNQLQALIHFQAT